MVMVRTSCITYNNDHDVACFGLDQLVVLLGKIILIPRQRVFALSSECYILSREAMNITFIVFSLTRLGLEFTINCK